MASSASGQDDPNRAMWLATRAGKMEPSCLLGTTRCIPQEKFSRTPYNKSFIDQVCSVKMAGYWPHYFFCEFMDYSEHGNFLVRHVARDTFPSFTIWRITMKGKEHGHVARGTWGKLCNYLANGSFVAPIPPLIPPWKTPYQNKKRKLTDGSVTITSTSVLPIYCSSMALSPSSYRHPYPRIVSSLQGKHRPSPYIRI